MPRPLQQLKAPEIGNYYHAVLSVFTQRLKADGLDLADLGTETAAARLRQAVDTVKPKLESDVLTSTAYYRYLAERLARTVGRTTEVLAEHARRGAFRPLAIERFFALDLSPEGGPVDDPERGPAGGARSGPAGGAGSGSTGSAGAGPARGSEGVRLTGYIDRLEVAEVAGQVLIRVIDFKSGRRGFNLGRAYLGLDLQLPGYLLGARTVLETEALTAGAFFLQVSDPFVSANGPLDEETLQKERMKEVRLRGLIVAEPEIIRLMDSKADDPGSPPILPVSYTTQGNLRSSRSALTREQLDLLTEFTHLKIRRTSREMLDDGNVAIAPVSLAPNDLACQWCDYRPVCRFDQGAGDAPRRERVRPDEEVWELMGKEVADPSGA